MFRKLCVLFLRFIRKELGCLFFNICIERSFGCVVGEGYRISIYDSFLFVDFFLFLVSCIIRGLGEKLCKI